MAISIRDIGDGDYDVTIYDDVVLTTVTCDPSVVDSWISEIQRIHYRRLRHLVVGLDVEWRPSFSKIQNPVATIQLSVGRRCLIFQPMYADYIPQSLASFLSDDDYTFVGVGIDGDAQKIWNDYNLQVSRTVDLRDLGAVRCDRDDFRSTGLKVLAREVLGMEIQKPRNITLSAWDQEYLSYDQIQYACADAFVSFEIGRSLNASGFRWV